MIDIRQGRCPVCSHGEIVESVPIDFAGAHDRAHQMAVVYGQSDVTSVGSLDPRVSTGKLRFYTCRKCGLTQSYADQPEAIPVNADARTRLIKAEG